LSFLDEDGMAALLHDLYQGRRPTQRLLPLELLGLVPVTKTTLAAQPVAALYAWEQRQLYLATSASEESSADQALMARAYAQALVDQRFDLTAMDARATTTDASLAIEALEAGDGLLLMAQYSYHDTSDADWAALTALAQIDLPDRGASVEGAAAWQRVRSFAYTEGRAFTEALLQAGGWAAVDRAYTDPPRSTEQVLHPERYLGQRDAPAWVTVPDIQAALGPTWTLLTRDTLGEFVLRLYMEEALHPATAASAADGWDGDVLAVWEQPGGRRVLVWRTLWDDAAQAEEFEQALRATITQRYVPGAPLESPTGPSGWAGRETQSLGPSTSAGWRATSRWCRRPMQLRCLPPWMPCHEEGAAACNPGCGAGRACHSSGAGWAALVGRGALSGAHLHPA
jgi:hypothetical protein